MLLKSGFDTFLLFCTIWNPFFPLFSLLYTVILLPSPLYYPKETAQV